MGRARGGFEAYASGAGGDAKAEPAKSSRGSARAPAAASAGAPPAKASQPAGGCALVTVCPRAVPAGTYGRYEVNIDRMLVRTAPSRQAAFVACTQSGTLVRGTPYDVAAGDRWLHLDEASCQEFSVKACDAWMLINGQGLGQLLTLRAEATSAGVEASTQPAPQADRAAAAKGSRPGGLSDAVLSEDGPSRSADASGRQAALLSAVRSGDTAEAVRLLTTRADPNACDEVGETALFEAAVMGQCGTAAALLLAGCDAAHRSAEGSAAADLATQPLLASTLRAFMGDALERSSFCTTPVFRHLLGAPAHEGLVSRLERQAGAQWTGPAAASPPSSVGEGARGADGKKLLTAAEVRSLEFVAVRREQEEQRGHDDGDFDWGRLLWDWRPERCRFRVANASGTVALSTVPESASSKHRRLEMDQVVHLLLSVCPFIEEDATNWVCVTVSADEDPLARSALTSAPGAWWVRWADVQLVQSVVRMTPHIEEAAAEKLLQGGDSHGGKTRHEQVAAFQIQCRARRAEDEANQGRYQSRVCLIASLRHTEATIDEEGSLRRGRATTGVATLAEGERRKREERLKQEKARELEHKRRLARARGKAAEAAEAAEAEAEAAAKAAPGAGTSGVGVAAGSVDWSKSPTARLVCPEVLKGRASVICPTGHHRHFLHESLYRCFCMQEWPDKELIVLDTGGDPSPFFTQRPQDDATRLQRGCHPSPLDDPRIRYVHVRDYDLTLGDKRNQMLQLASGEVIANFDDDNVYAPDYLTVMIGQLRASGAQTVRLSSCFSWDPFSDRVSWHDEMRGRGETFVHLKGPTRILRYDSKDVGEEESFTAACVAHDVDDIFGIFAHVHHGDNVSSLVQRDAKAPTGVPVPSADIPSARLRAALPQRRRAFVEHFGPNGPPKRFYHLMDMHNARSETESAGKSKSTR